MRLSFVAAAAVALVALAPAAAVQTSNGFQIVENFEDLPLGPASFDFVGGYLGTLGGGDIITATAAFPPVSGNQVYFGQSLTFNIIEKVDFAWPAIGASITGPAPVTMTVYGFDIDLFEEVEVGSLATVGGANEVLFFINEFNAFGVTRATFTSLQPFAIDDFIVGLPDVMPGIPEPASWAMLITGFGLIGVLLRTRRSFA